MNFHHNPHNPDFPVSVVSNLEIAWVTNFITTTQEWRHIDWTSWRKAHRLFQRFHDFPGIEKSLQKAKAPFKRLMTTLHATYIFNGIFDHLAPPYWALTKIAEGSHFTTSSVMFFFSELFCRGVWKWGFCDGGLEARRSQLQAGWSRPACHSRHLTLHVVFRQRRLVTIQKYHPYQY